MTEPEILAQTGKSIAEHQELTITNFLMLSASGLPFIPVLQGQTVDDYVRHVEMYASAGIELVHYETVGVGSVCRRQGTREAEQIFRVLSMELGIDCHGFGVKTDGLRLYGDLIKSSDSLAWSLGARWKALNYQQRTGQPWRCRWGLPHKVCNNCFPYAMWWRQEVVSGIPSGAIRPYLEDGES